jgi:adenylate cyclase
MERRLAAILAADVVGYSRLMGEDEAGTLVALKAHRRDVVEPKIAAHQGRIVKTTGDGVLAEFPSVVEAVACAAEMQEEMRRRNETTPSARRLEYRIGINLGDVILDAGDIYGDGVNVAARLEALAEPGGISVSRAVFENVRNKLDLHFEFRGEHRVKNIATPVAVYRVAPPSASQVAAGARARPSTRRTGIATATALFAVLAAGAGYWALRPEPAAPPADRREAPALPDKPSVAVLPFANMSDDPAQGYFSDGFTEDLIVDLSKLSGLFVIARHSTFAYKGRPPDPPQVARDLGIRYVVSGSVRKAGGRVRINAQLIEAESGRHLWAERYDRDHHDIFDLQDDVRRKIVAALAVKISPRERERLARKPTDNPEAYDYWARGLEQLGLFTEASNREARRLFARAVELDPRFARAYGQLANTYTIEAEMGWSAAAAEAVRLALPHASRAVVLDDTLPEAHFVLGRTYLWDREHDKALAALRMAVELNPNFADGSAYLGQVLIYVGRAEEALAHIEQAMRLNPHYPFWYLYMLGQAQFMLGRFDAAAGSLREALQRNPGWRPSRWFLAAAYGHLGQRERAEWELSELAIEGQAPSLRALRSALPYRDQVYFDRLLDGLRKAGASE